MINLPRDFDDYSASGIEFNRFIHGNNYAGDWLKASVSIEQMRKEMLENWLSIIPASKWWVQGK